MVITLWPPLPCAHYSESGHVCGDWATVGLATPVEAHVCELVPLCPLHARALVGHAEFLDMELQAKHVNG
jgi:hypothetical protein